MLGDVIREYLLVNLIVLFVFVDMGIILLRMYLRKKFVWINYIPSAVNIIRMNMKFLIL